MSDGRVFRKTNSQWEAIGDPLPGLGHVLRSRWQPLNGKGAAEPWLGLQLDMRRR